MRVKIPRIVKTLSPLLIILLLVLQSCSTKYAFSNSTIVPAADGSVKVKKDNNDNYRVRLKVKNLAKPQNLTPARDVYVVWMDTDRDGVKNIGQLKTSSGIFSSKLKSSLQTVSALKPRSFFITAENVSSVQRPNGMIVLRTE
jgi:hypothetical protein